MTLYPVTKRNVLDKYTASVVFKDLIKRLSRMKKILNN